MKLHLNGSQGGIFSVDTGFFAFARGKARRGRIVLEVLSLCWKALPVGEVRGVHPGMESGLPNMSGSFIYYPASGSWTRLLVRLGGCLARAGAVLMPDRPAGLGGAGEIV